MIPILDILKFFPDHLKGSTRQQQRQFIRNQARMEFDRRYGREPRRVRRAISKVWAKATWKVFREHRVKEAA